MTLAQFPWWLWGHVFAKRWTRLMFRMERVDWWWNAIWATWKSRKPLWGTWRGFLFNLMRASDTSCPHCRYEGWTDHEELFQVTDQGENNTPDGHSYWWEGMQTCARCGVASFHADRT